MGYLCSVDKISLLSYFLKTAYAVLQIYLNIRFLNLRIQNKNWFNGIW